MQATLAIDRSRLVPSSLAVLSAAGIAVSSYLTWTHWLNKPIACSGLGDCDFVNASKYASVGSIPVALFGVAGYLLLLSLALAWRARPELENVPLLFWGVALAGWGYAAYLTYVEVAVLHAICIWCVTSATILTLILVMSSAAVLSKRE